jgi:hypothetical protein
MKRIFERVCNFHEPEASRKYPSSLMASGENGTRLNWLSKAIFAGRPSLNTPAYSSHIHLGVIEQRE